MRHTHRAAVLATIAVASGFAAAESASTAPVDLIAKAGNQELSVERLASLMAMSSIPIQKDVATAVADFWVSYQLVAYAGAHGDTIRDSTTTNWWVKDTTIIDQIMWQPLLDARGKKFFDKVTQTIAMPDTNNLEQLYLSSRLLAAQHILIMLPEGGAGMTQAKQDSARLKAEDLRRRVTAANFAALAKEFSEDGGSKDNGGSYAMFGPGTDLEMVAEFDQAVRRAKPGEIVPGLVRTQFGFHIIRRHTLAEVRQPFVQAIARANIGVKGQEYIVKLRKEWNLQFAPDGLATARAVATNPLSARDNRKVVATSLAGEFTASRLAEWIEVLPADLRFRESLVRAPDSIAISALTQIISQEIIEAQAIKEGVHIDRSDLAQIRTEFGSMVLYAMTGLKVDPRALHDSAATPAARERLAAARVESALDQLFATSGKDFVEIAPPLATALRKRYPSRISAESIDLAVARALAGGPPGTRPPRAGRR